MRGRDGEEEAGVLLMEQGGSESDRAVGGELRRERSPFILTGFEPDRQGVGGCLSLKSQLFSSVKRCKLTSSGTHLQLQ